jgi:L-lactate dehydrogenase complex protein LldE
LDGCSERVLSQPSKVRGLLEKVPGIQLVELQRRDECCGFGGTFAVAEEGVSILMGRDRIHDHVQSGAQVVTATDMSCLMHLEGIARRQGQRLPMMHISQILVGRVPNL